MHRLDHDPLDNMPDLEYRHCPTTPGRNDPKIIKQDLNVGQDYAVRVQELKTSFKGNMSRQPQGPPGRVGIAERRHAAGQPVAMCYNQRTRRWRTTVDPARPFPDGAPLRQFAGGRCHVLSQMQQIDWITIGNQARDRGPPGRLHHDRILPAHAGLYGRRPDGLAVLRPDRTISPTSGHQPIQNPLCYGVVPDSYTQMDQLKISGHLTEDTRAYAFLMAGNTVNRKST